MILRRLKLLSDVEAAYIAGSIDADGCLYMTKQTNTPDSYRIGAKVTCKEKEIIDWLYEHTGVGHVYEQKAYSKHQPKDSVYWLWNVTSHKDVIDLIEHIYPYTITKRRRCELMYHMGKNMQSKSTHKLTDEQREWRKAIYEEFKSLQTHQPATKRGEFGGNPERIIPSQAALTKKSDAEGVEVNPEITDISAPPDREDMTRTTQECVEVQ